MCTRRIELHLSLRLSLSRKLTPKPEPKPKPQPKPTPTTKPTSPVSRPRCTSSISRMNWVSSSDTSTVLKRRTETSTVLKRRTRSLNLSQKRTGLAIKTHNYLDALASIPYSLGQKRKKKRFFQKNIRHALKGGCSVPLTNPISHK